MKALIWQSSFTGAAESILNRFHGAPSVLTSCKLCPALANLVTEEITRLSKVFNSLMLKVPEMGPVLESLRRYCMNDSTFDETDFRTVLDVWLIQP